MEKVKITHLVPLWARRNESFSFTVEIGNDIKMSMFRINLVDGV